MTTGLSRLSELFWQYWEYYWQYVDYYWWHLNYYLSKQHPYFQHPYVQHPYVQLKVLPIVKTKISKL